MKFNQLMKKIGYNTVVNVYKVTAIEHDEEGTVSTSSAPIGTFKRYDQVPEEIWTASIYEIMPGTEDTLLVLIEGVSNED
ncbi:hypothetical protein [Coprococcus comes]|uniref:hypothetical protein n=1 Tax=Coprococcus comes TaxID=410072 RepID=UPI0018979B26|nr:hypothetical protein [Coprococcus comes]